MSCSGNQGSGDSYGHKRVSHAFPHRRVEAHYDKSVIKAVMPVAYLGKSVI